MKNILSIMFLLALLASGCSQEELEYVRWLF